MPAPTTFNRLIFRAVLRNVNPMVIRVLAVPDYLDLPTFDEVFRTVLGWEGLGFIFRVHGQEYNSFRRRARSKTQDFQLRPQEKFLYTCGAIDLWEWEVRIKLPTHWKLADSHHIRSTRKVNNETHSTRRWRNAF